MPETESNNNEQKSSTDEVTITSTTDSNSEQISDIDGATTTSTIRYTISVQNVRGQNKYFVDGVQQQTLELLEGNTYIFSYPSSHPFALSTTDRGSHSGGSEYTTGVTRDTSANTLTYVVPNSAPQLYYYCTRHDEMGGTANINPMVENRGALEIFGCTDRGAINYNSAATVDDGSCIYDTEILGCTDPTATNYNSDATVDDGSCIYAVEEEEEEDDKEEDDKEEGVVSTPNPESGGAGSGVVEEDDKEEDDKEEVIVYVSNPEPGGVGSGAGSGDVEEDDKEEDDDKVPVEIVGCTDPTATNYNSAATRDDGSCIYGENRPTGDITYSNVTIDLSNFWVVNALKKTRDSTTNTTTTEHIVKVVESDPSFDNYNDNENLVKARFEQYFDTLHLYENNITYTLKYKSVFPFLISQPPETKITIPVSSNINTDGNSDGNSGGSGPNDTGVDIEGHGNPGAGGGELGSDNDNEQEEERF